VLPPPLLVIVVAVGRLVQGRCRTIRSMERGRGLRRRAWLSVDVDPLWTGWSAAVP
jgi:hypothetical protein